MFFSILIILQYNIPNTSKWFQLFKCSLSLLCTQRLQLSDYKEVQSYQLKYYLYRVVLRLYDTACVLTACLQGGRVTLASGLTLTGGEKIARVYKQNFAGRVTLQPGTT